MTLDAPIGLFGGIGLAGMMLLLPCAVITPIGWHWLLAFCAAITITIAVLAALYGAWKQKSKALLCHMFTVPIVLVVLFVTWLVFIMLSYVYSMGNPEEDPTWCWNCCEDCPYTGNSTSAYWSEWDLYSEQTQSSYNSYNDDGYYVSSDMVACDSLLHEMNCTPDEYASVAAFIIAGLTIMIGIALMISALISCRRYGQLKRGHIFPSQPGDVGSGPRPMYPMHSTQSFPTSGISRAHVEPTFPSLDHSITSQQPTNYIPSENEEVEMPEPAKPDTVRSVPSVTDAGDRPKTGASVKSKLNIRGKSAKSAKSALLEEEEV